MKKTTCKEHSLLTAIIKRNTKINGTGIWVPLK